MDHLLCFLQKGLVGNTFHIILQDKDRLFKQFGLRCINHDDLA